MKVSTALTWAMASQYLVFATQFATSLYLARYHIDPQALGLFSIAVAIVALARSFQDAGLLQYLVGLRRLTATDRQNAITLSFLLAAATFFFCLLIAWPAGRVMHAPGDDGMAITHLILFMGLGSLCTPFTLLPLTILQRRMDSRRIAYVDLGCSVTNGIVAIALAQIGYGALALAAGTLAQQLCRALLLRSLVQARFARRLSLARAGRLVRYGQSATLLNIAWLGAEKAPDLILGHHIGPVAVGLFARAQGLSMMIRQLCLSGISSVFYAKFSRLQGRDQPLGPFYEHMTAAFCALTWPAFAGLALLAEPILFLLFGPNWGVAAPALRWTALSQICFVALPLHIELPMLLGRRRALIKRCLLDTGLSVALMTYAATRDVEAAALSRCAFGLCWFVIHATQMHRLIGFRWARMGRAYGAAGLLTVAAMLPAALVLFFAPLAPIGTAQLGLTVVSGISGWTAMLWLLRKPAAQTYAWINARA